MASLTPLAEYNTGQKVNFISNYLIRYKTLYLILSQSTQFLFRGLKHSSSSSEQWSAGQGDYWQDFL